MSIFSVGYSGINAAQAGILTTSHNIANASTKGYSRQTVVQGTNLALQSGVGYMGQGVHVESIHRNYDQYLGRQVLSAETSAASMDSFAAQISQIDNLLADTNSGLSPALSAFFNGIQDVAANPSSIASRQSMLSAAQALTARFQSIDQRMTEIRNGTNTQIMSNVTAINTMATQLASMNQQIINAQSGSAAQVPNDLLDQRDQMVKDLNKLIGVSTVTQSDGSYNVFIGKGVPVVIGAQSYDLTAVQSPEDPERIVVGTKGIGSTQLVLPESQIVGGALGGLVAFRAQSLDAAQNALGRVALTLGQNFNDQHKLGMDLTGALGTNFFSLPAPSVRANTLNSGAGAPTVAIDAASIAQLSTSNYRLSFVSGNFQLTRLSDNTVTTLTTAPQVVDGMSIDTTGWAPANNDSFLIMPTRDGAKNIGVAITDTRAVAAAAPIRTAAALNNIGTGKIDDGVAVDTTNPAFGSFNTLGQLTPPVLIQFDSPTTYTLYDNSNPAAPIVLEAGIPFSAGVPVFPTPGSNDFGYRIKISGAPATGDKFTVDVNRNGVSDNRNAGLLGALQTTNTMVGLPGAGASATYQTAYSQLVSEVGSKANEVQAIGASQQGLADQATTALQQVAGVNLDEEAANLLRYQQAYQASAKIIEIVSKVFDEIIGLAR